MGKIKKQSMPIHSDNSGFSLLELLVSIIILGIIIIPLMNSFLQAMKINQKADKLQDYNNVASNIIENMKSLDLIQIQAQYAGQRIYYNTATGIYTTDLSDVEEGVYYFSIEDIIQEDATYDAMVKLSTGAYQYADTSHSGILMNNYAMPDIVTANSDYNAMFYAHMYRDSATSRLTTTDNPSITTDKSIDQVVIEYFKAAANDYAEEQFKAYSAMYADYRQELMDYQNGDLLVAPVEPRRSSIPPGDPQYSVYGNPDYCQEDEIETYIDRTFDIVLSDVAVAAGIYKSTANYQITYHCNWLAGLSIGVNTLSVPLESKNYGIQINNLYLYYEIFHQSDIAHQSDRIKITNNSGRPVNFYIVEQDKGITYPLIKFFRDGSGTTNIYTNMTDSQVKEYTIDAGTGAEVAVDETTNQATVNNDIISSKKAVRIFLMEVEIHPHTTGAIGTKYLTEELYKLTSNMED